MTKGRILRIQRGKLPCHYFVVTGMDLIEEQQAVTLARELGVIVTFNKGCVEIWSYTKEKVERAYEML